MSHSATSSNILEKKSESTLSERLRCKELNCGIFVGYCYRCDKLDKSDYCPIHRPATDFSMRCVETIDVNRHSPRYKTKITWKIYNSNAPKMICKSCDLKYTCIVENCKIPKMQCIKCRKVFHDTCMYHCPKDKLCSKCIYNTSCEFTS
jgi:hypothetical protein